MTRRVCFVTDELYPFTAGGIGKVLHNIVKDAISRWADLEIHFLIPSYALAGEQERIAAHFGARVHVHSAAIRDDWTPAAEHGVEYPPALAFTDSDWHAQSLDILRALKALGRGPEAVRFDVIEFPDYRGWAFCTLQEKLLGLDFPATRIDVRLHSTDGVLQAFEPREPSSRQAGRFDLERKALLDAERVVAHLAPVAAYNAQFYGFDEAWRAKVKIEFPPVLEEKPQPAEPPAAVRDILFITKLQRIKRPDIFVRGAATFLRAHPEFGGRVLLACHAPDQAFAAKVRAIIPVDLGERFSFVSSGPERDALLPGSLVVIPSAYESLNLAAYEAAAAGAQLVLNGACLAFGESTPWRDGVNCHKFDGSVNGLAAALGRAIAAPAPQSVAWRADAPSWEPPQPRKPALDSQHPLVSVVIPNHNLGRWLAETIASVAASTWDELEVVVVDDASTDPFDALVLERLEQDRDAPVRVVRNPVNRGLAASRNLGIAAARGTYVLPLDADDAIGPLFIEQAVRALEANSAYDVVVPTAGYFDSDAQLAERIFADYACFLGDAPSVGLTANRMSCATALIRRSLFEDLRYDETLDSYEDWSLYLQAVMRGKRFLVTNDVQFFYRRRPGSMITSMNPARHLQLLERIYASLPRPLPRSVQLFATLGPVAAKLRENEVLRAELAQAKAAAQAAMKPSTPVRHSVVDAANRALKKVPLIHPLLKRTVESLRSLTGASPAADRPLRYELADALNVAVKKLPMVHPLLKSTAAKIADDRERERK